MKNNYGTEGQKTEVRSQRSEVKPTAVGGKRFEVGGRTKDDG